jgi:hypothetical protein
MLKQIGTLVIFSIVLIHPNSILAQNASDNIDHRVLSMTTLVDCRFLGNNSQGTGFFFQELDSVKPNSWSQIRNVWLVTNRHVIYFKDDNGGEHMPEVLTFYLKKYEDSTIQWVPINISSAELSNRLRIFPDSSVDIAAIQVYDLIMEKVNSTKNLLQWSAVSEYDFPNKDNPPVHVADDIIVVGYPLGYYDLVNLNPIAKLGIIASYWGDWFNGKPYFLIDSKLFPGSSGSIVISKPANFALINGKVSYSAQKQFEFLGLFSGEPHRMAAESFDAGDIIIQKKQKYDVGIVWYYYLLPQLIKK